MILESVAAFFASCRGKGERAASPNITEEVARVLLDCAGKKVNLLLKASSVRWILSARQNPQAKTSDDEGCLPTAADIHIHTHTHTHTNDTHPQSMHTQTLSPTQTSQTHTTRTGGTWQSIIMQAGEQTNSQSKDKQAGRQADRQREKEKVRGRRTC